MKRVVGGREQQLQALQRRFPRAKVQTSPEQTAITLSITPSDPDFAFKLQTLECTLFVPPTYPASKAWLVVDNIPRGYAANIERGFRDLPNMSLLGMVNALDRQLEAWLRMDKLQTLKIVLPRPTQTRQQETEERKVEHATQQEGNAEDKVRREREMRQLVHRLGGRIAQDMVYVMLELHGRKEIVLYVPASYPFSPPYLRHNKKVDAAFDEQVRKVTEQSLLGHVNWLVLNYDRIQAQPDKVGSITSVPAPSASQADKEVENPETKEAEETKEAVEVSQGANVNETVEGKTESDAQVEILHHVFESESESSTDEISDGEEVKDVQKLKIQGHQDSDTIDLQLEMTNIAYLQAVEIGLVTKCERCKTRTEFARLLGDVTSASRCETCSIPLGATLHAAILHANSTRFCSLGLESNLPIDLLPSTIDATCIECMSATPFSGVVQGTKTSLHCRLCHTPLSLHIQQVKFSRISSASAKVLPSGALLPPKRVPERLGLVAGQPLEKFGACAHYKKSARWFRFSCCKRVFPCDKCHDAASTHTIEFANRMICGYCSREQNYSPHACAVCGHSFVPRRTAFWEGGKGTRDRTKLSKKDPRKYRRN